MRSYCKLLLTLSLGLAAAAASAQNTPVGKWHTIDDETGEVKSLIAITEAGGVLAGRIEQLLRKGADPKASCLKCEDDRKGQPMVGLEIIRGAKQAKGETIWEGGEILDPEKGKTYKLKLTPIEGGAKLQVRGYLGPFYRTQVWNRVQ
ncbi:hypothetical protein AZ34_04330 [Hylemonella gracilis str. Niagara R]|uniref:DUF2147 domain-containing protein n=1 Tax=Hylemonella gracilis str. Niagara R TaxID=1458275 RepID=A0A016XGM0_9BURK|nr:DUF2147 domain-containing protein [Hylemonella gracilis]EYC50363.1 hypothetical protein AZ34_04330 [Hylemonella gracilis str. Niagara R]